MTSSVWCRGGCYWKDDNKKTGIMNRFIFSNESRWVGLYKGNFCSWCKCFIFQHFGWQSSKWDIHLNNLTVWSLQTNSMWSVYKNNWGWSYDLRTFICLYSFTECLNLLKQPAHHITKCVDCYLFLIWPRRETTDWTTNSIATLLAMLANKELTQGMLLLEGNSRLS